MLGDDGGDGFVGGRGLCNGPEEGGGEDDVSELGMLGSCGGSAEGVEGSALDRFLKIVQVVEGVA